MLVSSALTSKSKQDCHHQDNMLRWWGARQCKAIHVLCNFLFQLWRTKSQRLRPEKKLLRTTEPEDCPICKVWSKQLHLAAHTVHGLPLYKESHNWRLLFIHTLRAGAEIETWWSQSRECCAALLGTAVIVAHDLWELGNEGRNFNTKPCQSFTIIPTTFSFIQLLVHDTVYQQWGDKCAFCTWHTKCFCCWTLKRWTTHHKNFYKNKKFIWYIYIWTPSSHLIRQ